MGKIAVIGSLNMDIVISVERMPQKGETIHGNTVQYLPGGKGANQAVALQRLGGDVQLFGKIGKDPFGDEIRDSISRQGLSTDTIFPVETATGIANITLLPDDNSIVVIPGANQNWNADNIADFSEEIGAADVLVMQLEIPIDAVHQALKLAKQHRVPTILNPAPAKQLPEEMLRLADFITPNRTELETLTGRRITTDEELVNTIRKWEADFGGRLIVTLGNKGAAYAEKGELKIVPALEIDHVRDTTGAGDCFNGALAYGIGEGWELSRSIAFAVAAASLSVTKFGAQAGMPSLEEVMKWMT
ncbi:ribokinase [Sediminibacillus halophilus]|uniref:Ribokinase n=1 Tax=Sediminibacillus halophilus TaxID=482461 RepID=A0A1G9VDJ8_9BACI|nr:ribokinase [Sediminibacillus halophilus]SDM70219.1 ribokinase [Sediminibacillus halophilus]